MKKEWSAKWKSSRQPRKQRKYRLNAPLHAKRKLLSANLSKPLRERYGKRSMVVVKGDEVMIVRGGLRKTKGIVEKTSAKKEMVYIEGVKRKKVDGSDVSMPLRPSNLMITSLKLDDKKRQAVLERSRRKGKAAKAKDEGAKPKKAAKGEKKGE